MGGLVMDMNRPCRRQRDVYIQEGNHRLFSLQKVTRAECVFGIEGRLNIFETELDPRIADGKDAETVSLRQRNGGMSALARQRRQSLPHRNSAGIRQGSCQIQNLGFNVECCPHRDSMMLNRMIDMKDLAMKRRSQTNRSPILGRRIFTEMLRVSALPAT